MMNNVADSADVSDERATPGQGIPLVEDADRERARNRPLVAPLLQDLPRGYEVVRRHELFGDLDLTAGVGVALSDGDYLRIKYLLRDRRTNSLRMHGWRLRRNNRVKNWLEKSVCEVCWIVTALMDDSRSDWERGLEDLPLEAIDFKAASWIRKIIFTNKPEPAYRDATRFPGNREKHWAEGTLVCRIKHVLLLAPGRNTKPSNRDEQVMQWLRQEDADEGCGVSDAIKVLQHTSDRVEMANRYGACSGGIVSATASPKPGRGKRKRTNVDEEVQEVGELDFQEALRRHKRSYMTDKAAYKAADFFCGGGGASGGIEETPFHLVVGLDRDDAAARTWSLNWPEATTYHMNLSEFLEYGHAYICDYAHAIHISFSCQAWSWANPHKGKDNDTLEKNPESAPTILAAPSLLLSLRPRLVSFENTDGLEAMEHHEDFYNAFLHSIISESYSIRWKVCDLANYGNTQHRKRLIVIASCPGEELPEFPSPTHGNGPGLKPYRTVRQAISGIDPNDPLHDVEAVLNKRQRVGMQPARWDNLLRRGFTTGGPTETYPDGSREFSIREDMDLMRYRRSHKLPLDLCRTKQLELIGNGVPRDLIRKIFKKFHAVLQRTDAKIKEWHDIDTHEEDAPPTRPSNRAWISPSNFVKVNDSDNDLPDILPLPRPANQRAIRQQRTIDSVLPIRRSAVSEQRTVRDESKRGWVGNFMDLT